MKELGADHVVNTATTDFRQWVWDTLGKPRMGQSGGVDLMVNYIGGDTWVDCLKMHRSRRPDDIVRRDPGLQDRQ